MTPDERKRGLRNAVATKVLTLAKQKESGFQLLRATHFERHAFQQTWRVDLLWEIIDALVEECATYQNAGAVLLPAMQYRCLWEEGMASMDGLLWIPFSGRVGTYEEAAAELENRRKDRKFRNIYIESRLASASQWPRPWEFRPAERKET